MSLISAWTLFLAMLLAQEMTTTPAPWQKRRSSERLHVEDALQHLAGVIQYLKSLGLSNERIKNAVDDHLERQDQESVGYRRERNWAEASHSTLTRHQVENPQQFFQNVISAARYHSTRIQGQPYGLVGAIHPPRRLQQVARGLSPSNLRSLASIRHQINQRGRSRAVPDGATSLLNSDETRLTSRLLRILLNYPKASVNSRKYQNRNRQEKVFFRLTTSRNNPENTDNSLSENTSSRKVKAVTDVMSTPNGSPRQGMDKEIYGLDVISKNIENPLPPIKGVALEIRLPDDVTRRQTVALSPGMSVYRALYQAALHYDGDDVTTNPFEVSIERDIQRKCYVISGVSGQNKGDVDHWLITVMDATGEVKYEGRCLMSNSKLPLRPGYRIHIKYQPHNK